MNLIPAEQYDRTKFIGGSIIPAILGVSPWKTRVQAYFDMVGWPDDQLQVVKPEVEKRWRRGKRLEPVVLDMIADEQPLIEITARSTDLQPNRYRDSEVPYFAAEVDFEWRGELRLEDEGGETVSWMAAGPQNGEIKTVHPFAAGKWGAYGTDEIPVVYLAQAMWGLGVTGKQRCMIAALFGADNLVLYRVERDEELISMMRQQARHFMEDHVLIGVPPEPQNAEDVTRIFRKDDGNKVTVEPGTMDYVRSLRRVNAELKMLSDAQTGLEFLIKKEMGARSILVDSEGNELVSWKSGSQKRVDTDLLKANYPDVYKACSKTIEFRKFLVKGKE